MKYTKLSQKPILFRRYTGLSVAEFQQLIIKIEPLWRQAEIKRLSRPNRQRQIGGGRKYRLKTFNDKLLLILVFYKLYLTYDLLGFLFQDLDKAPISRLIKRLEPILAKALPLPRLKRRSGKRISSLDELLTLYPEMREYLIDATEQQIARPKNQRRRKNYYSGKKKRHTIKSQLVVDRKSGKILTLSPPVAGRIHDYKLWQKSKVFLKLPANSILHLDRGYTGIKKDFPQLNVCIPKQANRWHKLTKSDKIQNHFLNQIRVKVEHSINKCKQFKTLSQIYRHSLKDYHCRFKNIAGLINFKLACKELLPVLV